MTLEDGQLFGRGTGQNKVRLLAETEMRFSIEGADAIVTFIKSQADAVEGLILNQNGVDRQAGKVA